MQIRELNSECQQWNFNKKGLWEAFLSHEIWVWLWSQIQRFFLYFWYKFKVNSSRQRSSSTSRFFTVFLDSPRKAWLTIRTLPQISQTLKRLSTVFHLIFINSLKPQPKIFNRRHFISSAVIPFLSQPIHPQDLT